MTTSPHIIAVSGQIGAGKTTLARTLGQRLRWPVAAYGDVVRAEAIARGLPLARVTLQDLGTDLAADWTDFTRRVLYHARWRPGQAAIIDGVRHVAAVGHLRQQVTPLPVVVVYLAISPRVGLERARHRDAVTSPAWNEHEHPVEQDLLNVSAIANLVVPGGADQDSAASMVIGWLSTPA